MHILITSATCKPCPGSLIDPIFVNILSLSLNKTAVWIGHASFINSKRFGHCHACEIDFEYCIVHFDVEGHFFNKKIGSLNLIAPGFLERSKS